MSGREGRLQQQLSAETPTPSLSTWLIGLPHIMAAGFQDWAFPKNQALKVTFHDFCCHYSPPRLKERVHRQCLSMGEVSVTQDRQVRWETQPFGENSTCPLSLCLGISGKRCHFSSIAFYAESQGMGILRPLLSWEVNYPNFLPSSYSSIPGRFCRPFWLNQARSLSITNIPWPVPEDHLHFTSGHPLPPDWSPSPHLLWHLRRTRWVFCYYPRGLSPSQTEAFELESLDNRELLRVLGWLIWYRCLRMETGTALSQPWNREGRRAWARRRQRIWGSASTGRIFLKEDSTYIRQGPDLWQGFPPLGQWCF